MQDSAGNLVYVKEADLQKIRDELTQSLPKVDNPESDSSRSREGLPLETLPHEPRSSGIVNMLPTDEECVHVKNTFIEAIGDVDASSSEGLIRTRSTP